MIPSLRYDLPFTTTMSWEAWAGVKVLINCMAGGYPGANPTPCWSEGASPCCSPLLLSRVAELQEGALCLTHSSINVLEHVTDCGLEGVLSAVFETNPLSLVLCNLLSSCCIAIFWVVPIRLFSSVLFSFSDLQGTADVAVLPAVMWFSWGTDFISDRTLCCCRSSSVHSSSVMPSKSSPASFATDWGIFTRIGRPKFIPVWPGRRLVLLDRTDRFMLETRLLLAAVKMNIQVSVTWAEARGDQGPVVQTMDSAIRRIAGYSMKWLKMAQKLDFMNLPLFRLKRTTIK